MSVPTPAPHWSGRLGGMGASPATVRWARQQPTPEAAWARCDRGDRLLWIAGALAGPVGDERRKPLATAAAGCARLGQPHWEALYPDDVRPLWCIETVELWARGAATLSDVRRAQTAALAAEDESAGTGAGHAAAAAVLAAIVAFGDYPSDVAYVAAYVAYADSAAAYADEPYEYIADGARAKMLRACADVVRVVYPTHPNFDLWESAGGSTNHGASQ